MKEVFIDMLSAVRVIRQLYHELEGDIAIKHGLTKVESSVLAFLHNNPDADTLSDIVYGRRLRKGNVSIAISSLEKKGLLCRKADEKDRRVTHLLPLPAADKVFKGHRFASSPPPSGPRRTAGKPARRPDPAGCS